MKTFLKYYENSQSEIQLDREYETTLVEKECYVNQKLDEDKDIICTSAKIYWGIRLNDEFNSKSDSNRGISDLEIIIKKVTCDIKIESIENLNDISEETIVFEQENISTDINILFESGKRFQIYPTDLEIDYDNNKCIVKFY